MVTGEEHQMLMRRFGDDDKTRIKLKESLITDSASIEREVPFFTKTSATGAWLVRNRILRKT